MVSVSVLLQSSADVISMQLHLSVGLYAFVVWHYSAAYFFIVCSCTACFDVVWLYVVYFLLCMGVFASVLYFCS